MTETQVDTRNENEGTAVEAGSKATERFAASGKLSELRVPKERVSLLAGALIKAANDIVVEHQVTYEEYNALKAWSITLVASPRCCSSGSTSAFSEPNRKPR